MRARGKRRGGGGGGDGGSPSRTLCLPARLPDSLLVIPPTPALALHSMWALLKQRLRRPGVVVVTVPALSPEQMAGWVEPLDIEYPDEAFDGDEYAEEAGSLAFYKVPA